MSAQKPTPGDSAAAPGGRNPLLDAHRFLRRGPVNAEGWSQLVAKDRHWERSYRGRWAHDKVVRSTHGVNCTGSCSWNSTFVRVWVWVALAVWLLVFAATVRQGPELLGGGVCERQTQRERLRL